jgi:hypothetical protein
LSQKTEFLMSLVSKPSAKIKTLGTATKRRINTKKTFKCLFFLYNRKACPMIKKHRTAKIRLSTTKNIVLKVAKMY